MRLSILMTASEAVPFAKEGGLADVVGALPKELEKMGHDVRLVMPKYSCITTEKYSLEKLEGVLVVPMGYMGNQYCSVYQGCIPGSGVKVYFLEHDLYFGRVGGLYSHDNIGYADNGLRFIFLSRASLELCKLIRFKPDIVHAHDWHTAAVPVFMNSLYKDDEYISQAASILTIHNMQYQGEFDKTLIDVMGIGWEYFTYLGLEKDDMVNLLKGGIYHATLINTVSEGYAKEICTTEHGWGLEDVVKERCADLYGILNGVDYTEWNPSADSCIPANFNQSDLSGKKICKRVLQERFNLPLRDDVPVFAMVSRLVKQKGIDVLAEALPHILSLDIQLVILGSGEPWSHFYFGKQAYQFSEKFACTIGYDNRLAHLIEAGSDFFLMPSAFEPCGMSQMYSMRYATLPIVRATGGLDDSVENYNEATGEGTGFKFYDLNAKALLNTIGWSVHTWYNNSTAIDKLKQNAMEKSFSWGAPALKYLEMYSKGIKNRRAFLK